ncbi:ATP-binding protein [Liquorilactobacillus sucicola DSM 21376 = JCM 15457]|nr:ATP-binding protein [Liquorilactobacillus sucicola DSM 21376 = JCM 15457]
MDGIKLERDLLSDIRSKAQLVVDTSKLTPRQLREEIFHNFETSESTAFHVEVLSFGFKYGLPIDADIVMDVRFLPNPYYVPELKKKTGLDEPVYEYVMNSDKTESFYQQFITLLKNIIPGYKNEGKSSVTIAIGCTGGQHRSVALAKRIGDSLAAIYPVRTSHRDIKRRKESINRS